MFLQASTTVPATKAASSSVGDPGSTRVVYLIVVILVLLAVGLGWFAYTFWRRTRPGAGTPQRSGQPRTAADRVPARHSDRPIDRHVDRPVARPTGGRSGARQWWDDEDDTPPQRERPVAQRPVQRRPAAPRTPAPRTPAPPRDPLL